MTYPDAELTRWGAVVKKNIMWAGFAVAAASASLTVLAAANASAAPSVAPAPDGTVAFVPNTDEWWTCLAGSLASPYLSIQVPQQGPAPQYAHFTPGIDVGVACAGSKGKPSVAKIVRPGD